MMIVLILGGLAGAIIENAIRGKPLQVEEEAAPIRLVNPRFVGSDDKKRGYTLTAASAVRDKNDYQRVILDKPTLSLDRDGPDSLRVVSAAGVYNERTRKLDMTGGVKITGSQGAFETAASLFDTKTGELIGSGPIQGAGSLGEINAKSYGVYDKGDRVVFKGGVRARIEQ
jgi:lipopolysaccharide export system protein LptC